VKNILSNSNRLLIIGSVAYDSIKTPFGHAKNALGGSASYFSLAARQFVRPSIVAVVGEDFKPRDLKTFQKFKVDISGLQKTKGKTFRWGGEYSFDLNSRTTIFTELNVFEGFYPLLSDSHQNSKYVFLGNIHPKLQKSVLSQIRQAKFVGLDTMNYWIERTLPELKAVLKLVNLLVINDSEARELSKEHNLYKAAKKILVMMKLNSFLIIKRGEHGLLMFHQNSIFNLPGYPLEDVVDPTGAGDSFAGGFMGYLAKSGNITFENLKRACVYGSVTASFCVEKMATIQLQKISLIGIKERYIKFKALTNLGA
jgi:sugar/nucleoside kinase (ribokinase family)